MRLGDILVSQGALSAERLAEALREQQARPGRPLGQVLVQADAITELRRALYLSPYEADAHLLMGRAYRRLGRPDAAATALRLSLWSRESAVAHHELGLALVDLRDVNGAKLALYRALTLDPGLEAARAVLATLPQQ